MYLNRATLESVAGFTKFHDWSYSSSTEWDNHNAWVLNFKTGVPNGYNKEVAYFVRAVKSF